jgi:small subunit ribosomal protein S2
MAEIAAQSPQSRHEANLAKNASLAQVGSVMQRSFETRSLITNPPTVRDASIEALMASQTHMGHHTAVWNPDNSRYIYGVRNGIHIISLEQTAAHLRRAAKVVEDVAYRAGIILFVGTRKGQRRIVTNAAALSGACHLFTKWAPGTITNREVMLGHKAIEIVDERDRPLEGFHRHLLDRGTLTPDLVVCMNPNENYVLLYECALATIPTIGVIDTDADPTWVTYAIPANDDR